MKRLLILSLVFTASTNILAEDKTPNYRILTPGGPFHSDDVPVSNRGEWFGLIVEPSTGKSKLVEGVIEIKKVKDELLDKDDQKTGKEIIFVPKQKGEALQPRYLLQGPNLRRGAIFSTPLLDPVDLSYPGSIQYFEMTNKSALHIYAVADIKDSTSKEWPTLPLTIEHFCIKAATSKIDSKPPFSVTWEKEDIFCLKHKSSTSEDRFSLVWAGDLNKDGNADIIIIYQGANQETVLLSVSDPTGSRIMLTPCLFTTTGC